MYFQKWTYFQEPMVCIEAHSSLVQNSDAVQEGEVWSGRE